MMPARMIAKMPSQLCPLCVPFPVAKWQIVWFCISINDITNKMPVQYPLFLRWQMAKNLFANQLRRLRSCIIQTLHSQFIWLKNVYGKYARLLSVVPFALSLFSTRSLRFECIIILLIYYLQFWYIQNGIARVAAFGEYFVCNLFALAKWKHSGFSFCAVKWLQACSITMYIQHSMQRNYIQTQSFFPNKKNHPKQCTKLNLSHCLHKSLAILYSVLPRQHC